MNIKKRGRLRVLSNSRSQATIFIIIAVTVILSGVLYFFYQKQSLDRKIEIIQPEIAPVKLYVEDCIKNVAVDGLERIGLSGGYIKIPEKINNNPKAYLPALPGSAFKVPYWWHEGIGAVPTPEFIKQELQSHLMSELKNCINNFEPFAGKYEINELKEGIADVQFNENDVTVSLKYPLEIISKNGNVKQLVQNFGYIIPIRFKKVYELAKQIMENENNNYFLEKKTIDLVSLDKDIPTTDAEATCKAKLWQLSDIKDKLKTLLRVNLHYIRIKGTDYNPDLYVPNPSGRSVYSETYFQQHYLWDIDNDAVNKFKNMKVAFSYDNWPLEIFARPGQNGVLRSNSQKGTDLLSFFCLHIWHFTYDISYPVTVSVIDEETDKNMAYNFNFAFKVNIDHNQPSRINTGTTLFETAADLSPEDFCNDVQNEITVFTVNNATGEDMRDVNMTFVCGRYYCDIGQSNWLSLGAAAGITKRLPYCVNGIIKGAKQGYAPTKSFIQTDVDGRSYVLSLNPVKEFTNYKVVKHLLSNPSIARELAPNEKASILIKGKNASFESFAVYPIEAGLPIIIPDNKDAEYEVSIYVADDENLIGGYVGDWKIGKESLKGANQIVFHVVEQGPASDDDRFLFVSGLSSYSKKVPGPELK